MSDLIICLAIFGPLVVALTWTARHDRKAWEEYEQKTARILPLDASQKKRLGHPEARGYLYPEKSWGLQLVIQVPDEERGKPIWRRIRGTRVDSLAPTYPPTYEVYIYERIEDLIDGYVREQKRKTSRDEFFAKYEGE